MNPIVISAAIGVGLAMGVATPAIGQSASRVYTSFDSDKCRHNPGKAEEDYGSWRCQGYAGIDVVLSAGDQRMQVSFGRKALDEPAAAQTFPAFNDVYKGTVEWRLERLPNGKVRPFATILRWNVKIAEDAGRRTASGQVLVVTRLNPGGVCHVGYVDARANPNANELAVRIADEHARKFDCKKDTPIVLGKTNPGLSMPEKR